MEFLKLILEDYGHRKVCVVCVKETAEYFGWDKAFPEWNAPPRTEDGRPKTIYIGTRGGGWCYPGGHRHRICREVSKQGHPRQATHCFRMQGSYSVKHLKMLADVAGDKYEWISLRKGRRVSRERWEASF